MRQHAGKKTVTNREISDQLVIEFETVRWHTKNIYSKLGVHTRTQAILRVGNMNMRDTEAPVPVQAAAPPRSNLPHYATSFVGREDELECIQEAFARNPGQTATLALLGLRGIGKTTLAAAYAEAGRFTDAVDTSKRAVRIAQAGEQEALIPDIEKRLNRLQDTRPQAVERLVATGGHYPRRRLRRMAEQAVPLHDAAALSASFIMPPNCSPYRLPQYWAPMSA